MVSRKIVSVLVVCIFVLSFAVCAFAGNKVSAAKKELMGQLTQAKKDFIANRDKLHDQNRSLRVAWHAERANLYMQAKNNPKDKAAKEQLNAGAKKFFADKKNVYAQLEQLRKDWMKTKKELGEKIKNTK